MACGIRCRNASPSRPPEANASRVFSRGCISSVLSSGMANRMKNGAALIRSVELSECTQM